MMNVLLVRHAEADDRDLTAAAGIPDEYRALTPRGRQRMKRVAPALATLLPEVSVVAASPLLRAVQTAEILAAGYGHTTVIRTTALAPVAGPESVAGFLVSQHGNCALVGHEPDLGLFASWALAGAVHSFIPFRKSGAALLTFPDTITPGSAQLLWLLTAGQLRRLPRK